MYLRIALDSRCSQRWTWTSGSLASTFWVLRCQACTSIPRLCGTYTWGLVHARQALDPVSHLPGTVFVGHIYRGSGLHEVRCEFSTDGIMLAFKIHIPIFRLRLFNLQFNSWDCVITASLECLWPRCSTLWQKLHVEIQFTSSPSDILLLCKLLFILSNQAISWSVKTS